MGILAFVTDRHSIGRVLEHLRADFLMARSENTPDHEAEDFTLRLTGGRDVSGRSRGAAPLPDPGVTPTELGRQPRSARRFFESYKDRIRFGTVKDDAQTYPIG
jgi:hypothetical protein